MVIDSFVIAIALFSSLCAILSLLCSLYAIGKLIGIQNTEYKVYPVQQPDKVPDDIEAFERELKKMQEIDKTRFKDLDPDSTFDELV